ncbi:hypothetical protein MMC30_005081 [Trapelia coarctata]|nr:hypothetical protein [Trapelia coarctata]
MASTTTDYSEIQQNEIEALRSIFMDDFVEEEVKTGAWNKTTDRAFRLKLKPQPANDHNVSATLKVTFPATYPKTIPQCHVTYTDGVEHKARRQIEELIKMKPKLLLGTEMIYELATSITEILEDVLSAKASAQDVLALDEERALQEAAAKEKAEQTQQERLQQQQDADEEEERMLSLMVKREQARVAKLHTRVPSEAESFELARDVTGGVTFDQTVKVKSPAGTIVAFRTVHNRTKYRTGPLTEVFTVCPVGSNDESAPFLVLKECTISSWQSEDKLKRAIQGLESNLETLIRLPDHPSIAKPLNFRIQRRIASGTDTNSGGWKVSILLDLARKGSVKDLLETIETIDVKTVRSWAIQIIEGLNFYHRHRVVHAGIRPENVLLESTESRIAAVKLADGLFQNELHSMKDKAGSKFSTASSAYWRAPEVSKDLSGKPSNSKDIWDLGVLILQMVFGLDVQRIYASPAALMSALDLSDSFDELLTQVFKADPRKRPSAFDLLPNAFLRSDEPVIDDSSSPVSRITSSISVTPAKHFRVRHDSTNGPPISSRYVNDFVEAGRLGKGGFGEVVRARHKLDGMFYAIKKIIQTSPSAMTGVYSEIRLLSSLNHPNVVRYYAAWVEEERKEGSDSSSSDSDDSGSVSHSRLGSSRVIFEHSEPGLDFISASGNPKIEFGYDSGDDGHGDDGDSEAIADDDEEDGEDASGGSPVAPPQLERRRRSSVVPVSKTTLYIQMEYCEKQTLRDLIRADLHFNIPECWRLFRQILEGLAHVHSHGIIHRDLKPDNVFIDKSNNVRLGDFGLARPGDYQTLNKPTSTPISNPALTMSIGTSIYVAPEVRSSGGGKYDEKADMYSLGIILFEMSYPLGTAMERADMLGRLREQDCSLPIEFEERERSALGDIIITLVRHKVSDRPSSSELLRSGNVPLQAEDETVKAAVRGISDTTSPYHARLMDALFTQNPEDERASNYYMYDTNIGPVDSANDLLLQQMIKERITEIFRHHGAVETPRPLMIPNSSLYGSKAARFLDTAGTLVQLPFDLTLPNARMIATGSVQIRKTYAFGDVYRAGPGGTHPKGHGEVDFDIVSYDNLDLALREAEVLKVIDEVIEIFPSYKSVQICYHIGHSRIVDGILSFCEIPKDKWDAVKEVLQKLNINQVTWAKVRSDLRAPSTAVPSTSLDDLVKFDFRDSYEKAIPKLRSLLQNTEELESTFSHLEAVTTYLARLNVKRKVYITPLNCFNEKFHRGNILFQCLFNKKHRSVLAAGGRYDRLITRHRPNTKVEDRHAVGFSLGWHSIIVSMLKYQDDGSTGKAFLKKVEEETDSSWTTRRCDVLVDSVNPANLRTDGLQLLQELWTYRISAELSIDVQKSRGGYASQYREDIGSHSWTVLIKQDGSLKARSLIRKEDVELRSSELVGWLRSEIRERDRTESKGIERTRLPRHMNHSDSLGISNEREPDVRFLISQTKSKKTNRRNIIEDGKPPLLTFSPLPLSVPLSLPPLPLPSSFTNLPSLATTRSHELNQSFLEGPIVAIETKDDTFDAIRGTRLSDPESWRRVIQNAPLAERAYLNDLHALLLEMAEEGKSPAKSCYVYNFRTRACVVYDLWRPT